MKLLPHLAASSTAGAAVWAGTGEPLALPIAIAAGVLPDGDHLLDYYFRYIRQDRRFQFYLLHGWEYLVTGIFIYAFIWTEPWMLALVVGYATQIGLDQISHGKESGATAYLISRRIMTGFRAPPHKQRFRRSEYQSFVKSLPFGRAAAERWFQKRVGPR